MAEHGQADGGAGQSGNPELLDERRLRIELQAKVRRLEQSEAQHCHLLQNLKAGVIVHRPDTSILLANLEAERLLGLSAAQMQGRVAMDPGWCFQNEDGTPVPLAEYPVSRAIRTLAPVPAFTLGINRPASGDQVWVQVNAYPEFEEEGNLQHVVVTFVDITGVKRAEAELREKTEELGRYFDSSLDMLCIADNAGRFLRLNPEWERTLGYPQAALEGSFFLDLVHPEDQAATRQAMAELGQQRDLTGFSNRYRCKDGSYRWIEWRCRPVGDQIYATARDITERKLAEDSLQESEARLRSYVDHSPIGVFVCDEHGRYQLVNPAASRITGYSREELLAMSIPELFPEEDLPLGLDHFRRLAETGYAYGETSYRHKDGRLGHWSVEAVRLSPTRFLGFASDITERKRSERERTELQSQLIQSQKMESLGVLAGGVAHDMNNVLGAILAMASAQLSIQAKDSPICPALETIRDAAIRGGEMVKNLLGFARQSPEAQRPVDLNDLLGRQARLLERTTLARINLVLDLAPDLRPVLGDAGALTHAFMNLCVNAVDAIGEGGTLTLHTRNLDPDTVEAVIEDDGSGMDREVLDRAMDPFFTTKEVGKGTGLGLSMVYNTVKAHRGQLLLDSEPGRGTRARLRFPSVPPVQAAAAVARAGPDPGPLQVLLVDDDELILRSTRMLVEVLGHAVTATASGEEAIAALERGCRPDVVILDMNMPGIGGKGTLPLLRTLLPEVPVLLATGRADQEALDVIAAHPGVTLLSKPYGLEELRDHLAGLR